MNPKPSLEEITMSADGYAFVSKRVSEDRQPVRFMYREQPDQHEDSGWRFFSGDESEEFANNPDNITINALSTVTMIDPDVAKHLDAPYGSAFERNTATDPFVKSDWTTPE